MSFFFLVLYVVIFDYKLIKHKSIAYIDCMHSYKMTQIITVQCNYSCWKLLEKTKYMYEKFNKFIGGNARNRGWCDDLHIHKYRYILKLKWNKQYKFVVIYTYMYMQIQFIYICPHSLQIKHYVSLSCRNLYKLQYIMHCSV